jgi:hypothetical protein
MLDESNRPLRYRYISKHTATGCYLAAWAVWLIGLLALFVTREYVDTPNEGLILILGLLAAAMVLCWVGALDRLAAQHDWGWFGAVLAFQLVGLGIVGMAAYMLAGPVDIDLSKPGISS